MDESEYIKDRLDDQINWYNKKSMKNQKAFKGFQLCLIILAAAIPLLSGFMAQEKAPAILPYIIAALGFFVTIISAILGLYKFQEIWTSYRTTCETLQREKFLYLTKTDPYSDDNAFNELVERVEMLLSTERMSWAALMKKSEKKNENQ